MAAVRGVDAMKALWLDRAIMTGPYFCLCVSEKSFHAVLKYLNVPKADWPEFLTKGSDATTHHLDSSQGEAHVVCIKPSKKHDGVQTYALLVHEAVHIWQAYREEIGEDRPASEQEAYSIQHLAQELMFSYDKQRKKRKHG
jgi:hypothetical protein